jgi:hypothetical protein
MDAGGLTRRAVVTNLVNGRSSSDNFELCSKVNVVLLKVNVVLSKVNVGLSNVNVVLSKVNVGLSLLGMVIRVLAVVVLGNCSVRSFRLWG